MSIELVRKVTSAGNGGEFDGSFTATQVIAGPKQFNLADTQSLTVDRAWTGGSNNHALFIQRAGGAVQFSVGYNDSPIQMYLGTVTSHPLAFRTNNTQVGVVDATGAWTFGTVSTTPTHLMRGTLSMNAAAGGVAAPTAAGYSSGDRILLYDNGATSHYGFGISSGRMWLNANQTGGGIDFYVNGASLSCTMDQNSGFTVAGTLAAQGSLARITGSAGQVLLTIEKTGDGGAGVIVGNNVGAGGTDKWWRMSATASAQSGFDISTVTDNNGSSAVNILTLSRIGQMKLNTSSTNALSAQETLSIACTLSGGFYYGGILFNPRSTTQAAGDFYMRFNDATQNRGGITATNTTTISYTTTSDARLKDNIVDFPNGYEMVKALQPRQFTWRQNNIIDTGFIAQELSQVYPGAVNGDPDSEDPLQSPMSVDYGKVTPVLAAGLKELIARFEILQEEFDTYRDSHV